ncbi:MAG: sodium:solute symporter family protein [Thermoanaerobaculales bacterium]|jgi:SSS family solute:Na+ symporter|nr:sodium:solute symporter family protein [Thermoanaerobaculales bacterium]
MHIIDLVILVVYFLGMLAVGVYFQRRQTGLDEYFVGGRNMGAGHIGFSVVATDVGGGFSIGLGGLGFVMGLSASWLLFSGLVGAWLAAVLLVPKVKTLGSTHGHRSFPDFLSYRFGGPTRMVAALVSAIGYAGFTGSQLLAGGKLASAAFELDLTTAVLTMSVVIVVYTALGGLQAVVYTDTIQWGILFIGLTLLALPMGYTAVGGLNGLRDALPPEHFSLTNVTGLQVATWMVTIVPIWFVAMTLYQRIHASRDVATARRAWFVAGLLEYPAMAFIGATLGLFARVLFPAADPEMGLPLLIRDVLPVGATGLILAAYFAAIMSTADSCLLASVGNLVDDIIGTHIAPAASERSMLTLSRLLTLVVGFGSVGFALYVPRVIDSILLAYSFMVAGLLFPTLGALFWRRVSGTAAFWSIVGGGSTTVWLTVAETPLALDPVFYGLGLSAAVLVVLTVAIPDRTENA